MQTIPSITCLWFSDLSPWVREGLKPLGSLLSQVARVTEVEISETGTNLNLEQGCDVIWVFARRWQKAITAISAPPGTRIFVSVLGTDTAAHWLFTAFFRKYQGLLPAHMTLVAHSPLSFRFLTEMMRVAENQVVHLPLPSGTPISSKPNDKRPVTVGALARFTAESNLNYFLNVAHYINQANPDIRFKIFGKGPLSRHLSTISKELGLEHVATFSDWTSTSLSGVDILCYSPVQNHHFLTLLMAGQAGIPVVACETPGIEALIKDGSSGFLVPMNDTKPMGELVLRLASDAILRNAIGSNLRKVSVEQFSGSVLASTYAEKVFGGISTVAAHTA